MPMVLIKNGDNGTWYKDRKGKAYPISDYTDGYFYTTVCGHGTVRREDGELLYTKAEYDELLSVCNELRRRFNKSIDDLARHARELVELKEERTTLLQKIERAVDEDAKKVELPREVAEAIEDFRKDGHDVDYIMRNLVKASPDRTRRLQILQDFSLSRGSELIMALINGYTVEQTPGKRLHAKVEELIYSWLDSPVDEAGAEEIHRLADRIVEQAQELITTT
ncbi:hypothetical protein [Paenibacillus campinasensis]|uniref:Uncharacterized protein n=1 Tax=Paenibacillus campinasensis TaxID=66347 RepID=A0A268ELF9_9BACL|nr:hypothetical protein [Paenibacillus campinasensis]PAD73944.1 hypothetical protein CHH67_19105 [Paenibacillus campinasensis]